MKIFTAYVEAEAAVLELQKALKYVTDIKAGKLMVIASGTDEEFNQAKQILHFAGLEIHEPVAV